MAAPWGLPSLQLSQPTCGKGLPRRRLRALPRVRALRQDPTGRDPAKLFFSPPRGLRTRRVGPASKSSQPRVCRRFKLIDRGGAVTSRLSSCGAPTRGGEPVLNVQTRRKRLEWVHGPELDARSGSSPLGPIPGLPPEEERTSSVVLYGVVGGLSSAAGRSMGPSAERRLHGLLGSTQEAARRAPSIPGPIRTEGFYQTVHILRGPQSSKLEPPGESPCAASAAVNPGTNEGSDMQCRSGFSPARRDSFPPKVLLSVEMNAP